MTSERVGDLGDPVDDIAGAEVLAFRSLPSAGRLRKLATRSGARCRFAVQLDQAWDGPLPFPGASAGPRPRS